jgi:hypothetical protein
VNLPSGGYVIVEPTEALVSIDVNTGRFTGKGTKDPEETILRTNLDAAREIARQLRLRDIGGIIVVDFIDMESQENRDKVLQELRTHLGRDRARTKAFAVSELGLIEMTRQRVRPSLFQSLTAPCEHCGGRAGLHPEHGGPAGGAEPDPGRGSGRNDDPRSGAPRGGAPLHEEEPDFLSRSRKGGIPSWTWWTTPSFGRTSSGSCPGPAETDVTAKYARR